MSVANLIKTAISSLKSHKLRSFLTMIGIIIGISSVVTILSIGNGLKREVVQSSEDTSANKINIYFQPDNMGADYSLIEPFTKSDLNSITRIEGVQKVEAAQGSLAGMSIVLSDISYFDKQTMIILDTYEKKSLDILHGRIMNEAEDNRRLIVLDYNTAVTMFENPEEALGKGVNLNGTYYEVIGVLAEAGMFSLTGSYSYISEESKESMGTAEIISSIDVYINPDVDKEAVFEEVVAELEKNHPNIQGEYELQDPQAITKVFEKIIGGLTAFIALITGISLFVGGIGVMNIMYVSVSERKREIGIRRAIGAKPKSILLQFLFEAIFITGIGGLLGILFGYLFSQIVGIFVPFAPVLTIGSFIGSTLTSVIVGVVFGIIPASKASKMDPIKAIYL